MFGTNVISDWREGSLIFWKGEWQGKKYEDRGVILKMETERLIQYSHFSPFSGKPDMPENYHTVTIELVSDGAETTVSLSQDNNETEQARKHSEKNWKMMLARLKKLLEK
ncbi:MAG: SRPBCC domain-containing protein [ANME-2 cluster archaeon]|nr:SRPBCC domain-containing protein [ANME-2 cluster archaeon]